MESELTRMEKEAVIALYNYESIKIAADHRCVSEHTQKNQIKSAMAKLEVRTQIGLIKEFFRMVYGVEIDLRNVRQVIAIFLLTLVVASLSHVNQNRVRRGRSSRRSDTELIIEL